MVFDVSAAEAGRAAITKEKPKDSNHDIL